MPLIYIVTAVAFGATLYSIVLAWSQVPLFWDGFLQFQEGVQLPWIMMVVIDLWAGFFLASAWIIYREKNLLTSIPFLVFFWFWGNIALAAYVALVAIRYDADVKVVLLGARARD